MIQERFNELQPYLRGVKVSNEFTIIESILKDGWKVDPILTLECGNDDVDVQIKDSDVKGFKYHMFYSKEKSIDELINVLDLIISTNIEIEQKQTLLRSKVEELKRLFEDKPLDELMLLKFSSEIDVTLNINKSESSKVKVIKEDEKLENNVNTEKV